MPANSSVMGFMILYSHAGQKHDKNTAQKIAIGTPIIIAPAVTYILPTIIGNIPKLPSRGFHTLPPRKLSTPISLNAGNAFRNINKHIITTAAIETSAQRVNTMRIIFSFIWFI